MTSNIEGNQNVTYVKEDYFKRGMEKFRSSFSGQGEVVFVVVSDDMEWIIEHFQDQPGVFIGSFRAKVSKT